MAAKLTVKRLKASDLTFFEWQFRNRNAGNQKAINLNADVLVDVLYPELPSAIAKTNGRIPVNLSIYGPGLNGELNLTRKIVKWGTYKNYRLNGEFVPNPDDSPARFNVLEPDDIAVIEFAGQEFPTEVRAVFVARGLTQDASLYEKLDQFLGDLRMAALTYPELENFVRTAGVGHEHPVNGLLLTEQALEDTALGGSKVVEKLRARHAKPKISRADLQRALETADENGQLGERFVEGWLRSRRDTGEITDYRWVSQEDATSTYDFDARTGATEIRVDAKSTTGEFERDIHLSLSQLKFMAEEGKEFWLCRVYEIKGNSAKMRVKRGLGDFAQAVLAPFANLPAGVQVDSVAVEPAVLAFLPEITLHLPEEPAGEEELVHAQPVVLPPGTPPGNSE